jgi:serine/threonine protein phosphatase 1
VRGLQRRLGERVCVLRGNHELALLDWADAGMIELPAPAERWLRGLPAIVEKDQQIFVHAGIDEEAGQWWRLGYEDWYFCSKFPATFGSYDKDIIAGHVGAPGLAGDDNYEGVFWDGESHYYIDGSTELTGRITVLRYSVVRGTYDQRIVTAQGAGPWEPIEASA